MSTHGVFVIKMGKYIWGFHKLSDGYDIEEEFYEQVKDLKDPQVIFDKAIDYFIEKEYSDSPEVNVYREAFNPKENYSKITTYTLYFDGEKFSNNFEE